MVAHGCVATHGAIRNFFSRMWQKTKNFFRPHYTNIVSGGKTILNSLLAGKMTPRESLDAAKKLVKKGGEDVRDDIMKLVRTERPLKTMDHGAMGRTRALYNIYRDIGVSPHKLARDVIMSRTLSPFPFKRVPIIGAIA